jgi:hypothetical protein
MKSCKPLLVAFTLLLAFTSCSNIPDKPIFEKLSTDELHRAIKSDTSFPEFYEELRKAVDSVSDIQKAKYNDITYRKLFNYVKYLRDTTYWKPLYNQWNKEWDDRYGIYSSKGDSILNYWRNYLAANSLSKYVKIEPAKISKEYYEYIGGLKEVELGFKLTPLQGTIEQIRFNYGYKAKINGDDQYYTKHNCILTSPLSSPTVKYWEVGYSDRDIFSGATIETFLRDYNVYIEVTAIRINGENKSIDDLSVPAKVSECFEDEKKYPALFEESKGELIKESLNKDYIEKWEFRRRKTDSMNEKKDKLCFDFLKNL